MFAEIRRRHRAGAGPGAAWILGCLLALDPVAGSAASATDTAEPSAESRRDAAGGENYAFEIEAPTAVAARIRELSYIGRWQHRKDYEPTQFPGLLSKLHDESIAILRSLGYYGGDVLIRATPQRVDLKVDAGARSTVARVAIEIDGPAQADKASVGFAGSRWLLPEGSFFESQSWERGKRGLIDALNQRGYLRAKIRSSEARVDPALTSARLEVRVDSGPRIAFGDLKIEGLSRHHADVVENLRPFRAGDPYSLDQMLAFQAALRASGFFSGVSVVPDLPALDDDPGASRVPLQVELVEYQAKRSVFGIGFSSEQGVRGQIGFEHRNLFGRSWQLESSLIAETHRQRLFANVRTPNDETGHFIGFGGRVERLDAAGQLTNSTNLYIGRGKHTANIDYFLSVQHQSERNFLEPAVPGDPEVVTSAHAVVLGYSWNLRKLDSRIDPSRGYSLSTQISGAREGFGSSRSFVRVYGRAMRFVPMPRDSFLDGGRLVVLGELGLVGAGSRLDIPSENLFRAGGPGSIRGYGYQTLGVAQAGAIVGGRYLGVASVEYQHPVSESIAAALFYDWGNAGDDLRAFRAVAGYGVGMRWRTPVGPLNLDLAYGAAVERWRLHFSVGYTF